MARSDADEVSVSRAEVEKLFRDQVKQLSCPSCGETFTDAAVDYADGWLEGRVDTLQELGREERDGPIKLRCELCGGRSRLDPLRLQIIAG